MYLSIPYDKGWKVSLNGNAITPVIVASGMIGVPLQAGQNTVELKFNHIFIGKGMIMSALALVMLIISLFLMNRNSKLKREAASI